MAGDSPEQPPGPAARQQRHGNETAGAGSETKRAPGGTPKGSLPPSGQPLALKWRRGTSKMDLEAATEGIPRFNSREGRSPSTSSSNRPSLAATASAAAAVAAAQPATQDANNFPRGVNCHCGCFESAAASHTSSSE
eukprot:CAMPEP_0177547728 /NCGR_PEP_ID=MMETSP0369-20130122/64038_1 /TAXON_ID=447022 ORGANISM="Scrippsiella hangoei-like, Strain SHHI-4" /NCGR_SAMPLE_ID=MMETSP0369 /ASSEMBLY_ACC=CAM_ASM_000364 /LENGTH=136 /DNA_ID=CAMNT_0019032571 /DNA_START=29 /DNA_END=437 /DNA_ORIENTATION=+